MNKDSVPQEPQDGVTTSCTARQPHSDKMTIIEGTIRKFIKHGDDKDNSMEACSLDQRILADENIESLRVEAKRLYQKCNEQSLYINKIQAGLQAEQEQANTLINDNYSLKKSATSMSIANEQEEEFISNKLLKHITGLKKEKGELLAQVEQEEEWLTNSLQKKLAQLQKEKIDLENTLEQEQEYMVNRLQKQLDLARQQQTSPSVLSPSSSTQSPSLLATSSPVLIIPKRVASTSTSSCSMPHSFNDSFSPSSSFAPGPPGLLEILKNEVISLKAKAMEMEREYHFKHQQYSKYKAEVIQFRKQNNLSIEDIDDGRLPRVFRSAVVTPAEKQEKRSTSASSQRSVAAATGLPPTGQDHLGGPLKNN